jgi:hypothetical protein
VDDDRRFSQSHAAPTKEKAMEMKKFSVEVVVVPLTYMIQLGLAKIERKVIVIEGYTLKDAKRRAGIQ